MSSSKTPLRTLSGVTIDQCHDECVKHLDCWIGIWKYPDPKTSLTSDCDLMDFGPHPPGTEPGLAVPTICGINSKFMTYNFVEFHKHF